MGGSMGENHRAYSGRYREFIAHMLAEYPCGVVASAGSGCIPGPCSVKGLGWETTGTGARACA